MEYKTKFIEDFSVGMESTTEKTVTIEDIKRFAEVSGDFNPVHLGLAKFILLIMIIWQ
mgnify:CR=1 FL=1